jgi:spore coat protein U-like protein
VDVAQAAGFRSRPAHVEHWNSVMKRSALVLALFAAALGWQGSLLGDARASEAHGRVFVAATVSSFCDIGGSPSLELARGLLDFGHHSLVDTALVSTDPALSEPVKGSMPLVCSDSSVAPLVSFDYGLHAIGNQRNLQGPGGTLIPYDLLRGSSISQGFWDDHAYPVSGMSGRPGDVPVYGRIRSLPNDAKDGFYDDTVTVRIDF